LGGLNISVFGHVFQEYVQGTLFFQVKRVDLAVIAGVGVGFEVNGMVPLASGGKGLRGLFFKDSAIFMIIRWYHFLKGSFPFASVFSSC
jgi:hypothetical protein